MSPEVSAPSVSRPSRTHGEVAKQHLRLPPVDFRLCVLALMTLDVWDPPQPHTTYPPSREV